MIDIVIGKSAPIDTRKVEITNAVISPIEAKMLNIRKARRRQGQLPEGLKERRWENKIADSVSGRILTLLITDEGKLPFDINLEDYRVYIKFVQRKK